MFALDYGTGTSPTGQPRSAECAVSLKKYFVDGQRGHTSCVPSYSPREVGYNNGDDYDNGDVVVETVFHELLILQKGQFYDVFFFLI